LVHFAVRVFLMRRYALCLAAICSTVLLGGAGQQAPQRLYQAYSDQEKADLDKISAYLNGMHSLRAGFIQIGPQGGVDQGEVAIQKPGQIRFEYRPPSPVSIVATGGQVYVKNSKLNTVDNYDLSDTPLGLLLNETVDLKTNKAVLGVVEQEGAIIVRARTSTNRNNSNITLMFTAPNIELRQWTVKDAQGGNTTVALRNLQPGAGRHRLRPPYLRRHASASGQ
jgi:outer membrane lipoprotein-sorting protein